MDDSEFVKLVEVFERDIIVKGVRSRKLGKRDKVSSKNCKLSRKPFGAVMGAEVDSDESIVIDYYGYQKKSRGFNKAVLSDNGDQKLFAARLVHFASIRIQDLVIITGHANLILLFPSIKNEILIRRGFLKGKENG